MIPTPYLALAMFVLGLGVGWSINGWRWEAKNAAALEAAIEERTQKEKEANQKSTELELKLAELSKQNRSLMGRTANETRLDSYRCPVPLAGLQLLAEARTGIHTASKSND